ncbi:MAG: DUF1501 domain-containing protein [Pirellulales bacterium]|nr:DUF1501 domain-containing protein [Pirellulales bacterium]
MNLFRETDITLARRSVVKRRDFIRAAGACAATAGVASWTDVLKANAPELRKRGKACILLWMQGGPSHFETFSPKPGHENGGETKAIKTSVSGVHYSENLPHVAKVADELAVVRSMTGREGNHQRATFLMHTGYQPSAVTKYPTLGSMVAHEIGDAKNQLPAFVKIGGRRVAVGGGFLGREFDPLVLRTASQPPENTVPRTDTERFRRRLNLLGKLDEAAADSATKSKVAEHRKLYGRASRMILSPEMQAFDLDKEPSEVRESYGEGNFAAGCLMARRLVEAGVTFVEVEMNGWDTHQDNFNRSRSLCEQIDQPFAQLVRDLKQRGLLDSTLIVWMGEFGRTPKINPRTGRDHYPKAFNAALAGCGIQGGQVVGKTDAGGAEVTDRPVEAADLFRSIYYALGIDSDKENMSAIGRPVPIVEDGARVKELFG